MLGKKKEPSGAPAWVLTYGDMMSLLLCFFIMLAAFADYEKGGGGPSAVMAAMQSIQEALGMSVPRTAANATLFDFNAIMDRLKRIIEEYETRHKGDSKEDGVHGRTFRLRRIRDGMEVTVGGPILFEPFSPRLTDEGKEALLQVAEVLKGHRNKLEIIGHAAEEPRPRDWTFMDAMQLSYERARHVADELIRCGVDPRTIRLAAAGANERVRTDDNTPYRPGDNRRVEIIVRESVIDDYAGEIPASESPVSQPGG